MGGPRNPDGPISRGQPTADAARSSELALHTAVAALRREGGGAHHGAVSAQHLRLGRQRPPQHESPRCLPTFASSPPTSSCRRRRARGLPDLTQGLGRLRESHRATRLRTRRRRDDDAASRPPDVRRSPDLGPGVGHLDAARALIASIAPSDRPPTLVLPAHAALAPSAALAAHRAADSRPSRSAGARSPGALVRRPVAGCTALSGTSAASGARRRVRSARLRGRLNSAGLFDQRRWSIVTADHGASFRPGDLMRERDRHERRRHPRRSAHHQAPPQLRAVRRAAHRRPARRNDRYPADGRRRPRDHNAVARRRRLTRRRASRSLVGGAAASSWTMRRRAREFAAADIAMGLTSAIEWKLIALRNGSVARDACAGHRGTSWT